MSLAISLVLSVVIYVGFGIIDAILLPLFGKACKKKIPDSAPVHEKLDSTDHMYLNFNKLVSVLFLYHCFQLVDGLGVSYDFTDSEALLNSLKWLPVHFVTLFIVFDFFYTLLHWGMHWPAIYPLVHKHHHKQHSPYRGNTDAINVHPIEYVLGEYNHLWTFFLVSKIFGTQDLHAFTFIVFLLVGGFAASLNHTRIDFRVPFLYSVFVHDVHHAVQPRANYGQYTMFWDWVFGTFLPSDQAEKMAKELQARRAAKKSKAATAALSAATSQ